MSCNPCAITVNPQKVGLVVDYLAGGARPEYKAGGFVVRPQNIGMIIAACKIPSVGPEVILPEPEEGCVSQWPLSTIVSWVEGVGSPTIDGPVWVSNTVDAAVNDPIASTIADVGVDTGKYYAEFSICGFDSPVSGLIAFGWKNSSQLSDVSGSFMAGIWWDNSASAWKYNSGLNIALAGSFTVQPPSPAAGQVFGVALDCSANKLYLNYNGTWLSVEGEETTGGNPADGNGWDIANVNNEVILYSSCSTDNATFEADDPKYSPLGYTDVT